MGSVRSADIDDARVETATPVKLAVPEAERALIMIGGQGTVY